MATSHALSALGIVCSLGGDGEAVWQALVAGDQSGLVVSADWVPGRTVCVAPVRTPLPEIPAELAPYASRNVALTLAALAQIRPQVDAAVARHGAERVAVVMGSSTSGVDRTEAYVVASLRGEPVPADFALTQHELGTVAGALALAAGLRGPALTISTACASSGKAFASARQLLDMGLADAVVVGGADSLCRLTVQGFACLEALSRGPSNPFSRNREGISIGEGAALFLMTREPGGVRLLGVGESSDAHHMSAPEPEGRGALAAMAAALADAGLTPADIAYINLHGTGTSLNDAMESKALATLFAATPMPWCSSTKALHGHTLGAAGAIEAAVCWLWLTRPEATPPLPVHRWDGEADPALPPLPLVPPGTLAARTLGRAACLSNSFAFGGSNCTLILARES